MPTFEAAQERNMILFIGTYTSAQSESMRKLSKLLGKDMSACVLVDTTLPPDQKKVAADSRAVVLDCDFSSSLAMENVLKPYKHRFLAATAHKDRNVVLFKKIIPHIPYIHTPTAVSLEWTTNKIRQRQLLRNFDKSISPKFMVVHDDTKETMQQIEKQIGFPLIIKPAGLARSLLVTLCFHQEELEANLKNTVKKINKIYKREGGRGEPQILVEGFMEGSMYSIDTYVNQRGVVYHAPMVHVRTGRSVGFDDFFGYAQLTPVKLLPHRIEKAHRTAEKAIEALNLRSTTCHIELIRSEDGWKVIEVGPRVGGFRDEVYEKSYGIDHNLNDILIRIPKKPILTKKSKGFTMILKFYPPKKGRLEKLEGIKKIQRLESFSRLNPIKQVGDLCDFASNGDDPIFYMVLFNSDRSKLLADVRRVEKTVNIQIKQPQRNAKIVESKK
ncbi:ATP-grasp domain-containing protein [Candidatus Parcubacteria bacterium]|nr:ATP-grasp domain-containing protein [Candidatus Parcubacteria bacterium]